MLKKLFTRKSGLLIVYLAVLPIATAVSVLQRYGDMIFVVEGARPMVVLFNVGYLCAVLYLTSTPSKLVTRYLTKPFVVLVIVYATTTLALSISRFHFSLGFVAIFVSVTTLWVMLIERARHNHQKDWKCVLIKHGRWNILDDSDLNLEYVEESSELKNKDYSTIIVDYGVSLSDDWLAVLSENALSDVTVVNLVDLFEIEKQRVSLDVFKDDQLPHTIAVDIYSPIKRIVDIGLSLLALIALALPVTILAIIIRLASEGPGVYKQTRIGKNGRQFSLYKLRTMYLDAEQSGPMFSANDDPRVTGIGRFLRRYKIDELPQILNVLKGDMSIVGPRPERPQWVEGFKKNIPYYDLRHVVRPGMTGWAQVKQGYAIGESESIRKLEYDLYYIKHMGPLFELGIIVQTLRVLFFKTTYG